MSNKTDIVLKGKNTVQHYAECKHNIETLIRQTLDPGFKLEDFKLEYEDNRFGEPICNIKIYGYVDLSTEENKR